MEYFAAADLFFAISTSPETGRFLFGKNEEGAALREDVDKALKEMKEDGTLSKITTEYLGVDTSPDEKYFDETPN